jgi:Protein of unknown function (DUF1552)
MHRRDFMRHLCATPFLYSAVQSLRQEASADNVRPQRVIFFVDGNGWGHQGHLRDSETLAVTPRSETDWDLPAVLSPLLPFQKELNVMRRFSNGTGRNLHGNGWGTLSSTASLDGNQRPGGVSIDRHLGRALFAGDAFPSLVFALSERSGSAPICCACDGPGQVAPAFTSPLRAWQTLFGSVGDGNADVVKATAGERSLLDSVCNDIVNARKTLAGPEAQKLDQLLTSCRDFEQQLAKKLAILEKQGVPVPPSGKIEGMSGLKKELIRAQTELSIQALSFGLTHVVHLSMMGFDAHNAGWGDIGVPGDAHENIAHMKVANWVRADYDNAILKVFQFKSAELAYLWQRLKSIPEGGGTMADNSLVVWINSGGGKHHNGNDYIPVVTLGTLGGRVRAGRYLNYPFKERKMGDFFTGLAHAMGLEQLTRFGDAAENTVPLVLT